MKNRPSQLAAYIASVLLLLFASGPAASAQDYPAGGSGSGGAVGAAAAAPDGTASGGGAVADFDSLMMLIQSTVEPGSWDTVGGNSTMQPYAGGVRVDGDAALPASPEVSARLSNLRQTLLADDASVQSDDWRAAARIRVVSLTRLARALQTRIEAGQSPDEAMLQLAGISRIRCVVLDDASQEILVAGTVGGFVVDPEAGLRDAHTGAPPIALNDFVTSLSAGLRGDSFGCSIDPTPAGLAAAQRVASSAGTSPSLADALVDAMGFHQVSLFGVPSDSTLGLTLVAADLHMKHLVLDEVGGPPEFVDYLSAVQSTIGEGPPGGELLRFWFAPRQPAMRRDADGTVFSWTELPMCLLSEREMADAEGQRRIAGQDLRAAMVARSFSEHLPSISQQHPIYWRLANVFESTMCGALIRRQLDSSVAMERLGLLATPDSWLPGVTAPPQRVRPLVVQHRVRDGRLQHNITIISGGVRVDADALLPAESETQVYPTLTSLASGIKRSAGAEADDRWWWNAR